MKRTKNLLAETLEAIEASGHSTEDIVFIGSLETGHRCTWLEYEALADAEYEYGYGAQLVASDLVIAFSDGQRMVRGEFDGSEYWDYRRPYIEPTIVKKITSLFVSPPHIGWRTIEQINEPDTD